MLFVGRKGPVGQLSRWLQEVPHNHQIRIGSIYGPGGIGKTFLLDYCLDQIQRDAGGSRPSTQSEGFAQIRIDGRKDLRSLEALLVEELPRCAQGVGSFPALAKAKEGLDWIASRVEARLARDYADSPELCERLRHVATYGLRPARALAQRPYDLALHELSQEQVEEAITTLQGMPALQAEAVWPGSTKRKQRNALRSDLEGQLVDALCADLDAALGASRKGKPRQLLLIFDDYESIEPLVGDFLVTHLIDRLQRASFPTLLLFVGRDNLLATNTAWGQHHRGLIDERMIELVPFGELEAMELMRRRGLLQTEVCKRIWEETQGYPFLLDMECEDALSGGRSALGLKLFFDRLTRWMTPIQRTWIVPLAFLDEITLESVSLMMPEHNPDAILAWFKAEPAIRDPHAPTWQVLPFVKRRIQQCLRNDSPRQHASLVEAGQAVAKAQQNKV